MDNRLTTMEGFVRQRPDDPFPRYALAMEYKKAGRLEEAVAAFRALSDRLPAYVPAYLQHGLLLSELGRDGEARAVFDAGLERARAAGDLHAAGELERERDGLA